MITLHDILHSLSCALYRSGLAHCWNEQAPAPQNNSERTLSSIFWLTWTPWRTLPARWFSWAAFVQAVPREPRLLPPCGFKVPWHFQSAVKGRETGGLHRVLRPVLEMACITSTLGLHCWPNWSHDFNATSRETERSIILGYSVIGNICDCWAFSHSLP